MKDYYKILGVNKKSSGTEIKKVFRRKALLIHPDKSGTNSKEDFIELDEAYALLVDKKKRARYDKLYDLFFNSATEPQDTELKKDLIQISQKGSVYANNFRKFDKEVLQLILVELFFGVEDLVVPALSCLVFGLWTLLSGLLKLHVPYLVIGSGLIMVGLLLAKRKWYKIQDALKENAR